MLKWFWLLPVYSLILIPNDEGRGIWILSEIFYWCYSRFSTGHPSSLHLHILQNSYASCQNVSMSMGICAMCNIMHCIHMQLSSLSELHTLISTGSILSQQWNLSAGCRIYNYDLVFQYDIIRFWGLTYCQNSRENADLFSWVQLG